MSINLSVPLETVTPELKPKLTVIGVGGAGGNAVNNMIRRELEGVDFVVANTDAQALQHSQAEARIQLGPNLTQGLGAGSQPQIGRAAAEEAIEEVLTAISGSHMAFIAAGMGGGTGTGAAPAIAKAAKEAGILTVAVVTKPFQFEGGHRMRLAEEGIEELEQYVDTLIIIPNQNLFRVATENTTFADAFSMADEVLYSGVRGVTDLMVMPGLINLDFADIRSVMSEMGKAMMGTGEAEGERRALDAAEAAIANPLLDDTSMKGAKGVLINITGGNDITLFEVDEAASRIRAEVDHDAYIIIGSAFDDELQGKMRVSVVATGIDSAMKSIPQTTMLDMTDPMQRLQTVSQDQKENSTEPSFSDDAVGGPGARVNTDSPLARLVREAQATNANDEDVEQIATESGCETHSDQTEDQLSHSQIGIKGEATESSGLKEAIKEKELPTIIHKSSEGEPFIPPPPASPGNDGMLENNESQANNEGSVKEVLIEESFGHEKMDNNKRPSLFERVTRTGRAAINRTLPDNSGERQVGAADVIETSDPGLIKTRIGSAEVPEPLEVEGEGSPILGNGSSSMGAPVPESEVTHGDSSEDEDLLDIPAFLRRQAN